MITPAAIKAGCAGCSMHQLCLPMGLNDNDMARLDQVIGRRRRVAAGELVAVEALDPADAAGEIEKARKRAIIAADPADRPQREVHDHGLDPRPLTRAR